MQAVVFSADVVDSRRIASRPKFGRQLQKALQRANREAGALLLGRFEPLKGVDEFEGVVKRGAPLGRILTQLFEDLHPQPIRLALVAGEVERIGPSPGARAMDGPAFHKASRLLRTGYAPASLVSINIFSERPENEMATHLANLLYLHQLGWTPRQMEVFRAYGRLGGQKAVARELGITQPTVSAALQRIHGTYLRAARDYLIMRLSREGEA